MFEDMIVFVQLREAVETSPFLTLKNSFAVFWHRKEVLLLNVRFRHSGRQRYQTRHFTRKNNFQPCPGALAANDLDATLRMKTSKLFVNNMLRRWRSSFASSKRKLFSRRLEAYDYLALAFNECVAQHIEVDCLLVDIKPRGQMILELREYLGEFVHRFKRYKAV